MIRHVRVRRTDHANVVDALRRLREKFRDFDAAFPVFLKRKRRLERRARLAFRLRIVERQRFAVILRQHRLRVERIDMRRPAVHEQMNHALGLRRQRRALRRHRIPAANSPRSLGVVRKQLAALRHQPGQRHRAKAGSAAAQRLAASEKVVFKARHVMVHNRFPDERTTRIAYTPLGRRSLNSRNARANSCSQLSHSQTLKLPYALGSGFSNTFFVCSSRNFFSASAICGYLFPKIAAAINAALIAPAFPIASVATGIPAGICTIDNSESSPCSAFDSTGTPNTGKCVFAAVMPGRCAAPPAPAMMTSMPRPAAPDAYSKSKSGVRCAETTRVSKGTPSAVSVSAAWLIVSQSDFEPMMIPTSAFMAAFR